MNSKLLCFLFLAVASISASKIKSEYFNGCSTSDCLIYDLSTQNTCTLKSSGATSNMKWVNGLSRNVDYQVLGGRIVAFQIRWFNGAWSGWYIPGINDIDYKFNTTPKTMRRMWSYFYDHSFQYIICV